MPNDTTAKPGEGTTGAPDAATAGGTEQGKPAEKAPTTTPDTGTAGAKPQDQKPSEGDKGKPGSFLDGAAKGTETKPDAGKPAADFALKVPEGAKVEKTIVDGFTAFAKEKGITAEHAQAALDFYVKQTAETEKALVTAWEQRQAENRKALEAHPTLGGANLQKSQNTARIGISELDRRSDGLGTKTANLLMEAGLGDHPVFAELFVLLGSMASEDRSGAGAKAGGGAVTEEQRARSAYPNTFAVIDKESQANR